MKVKDENNKLKEQIYKLKEDKKKKDELVKKMKSNQRPEE